MVFELGWLQLSEDCPFLHQSRPSQWHLSRWAVNQVIDLSLMLRSLVVQKSLHFMILEQL